MAVETKWVEPKPTKINGGKPDILKKMIACWEACREANTGGYGSWVVKTITGWGLDHTKSVGYDNEFSHVTSCSPFTATVCGMMFDPDSAADSTTPFKPMYDNGTKPIPALFYALHNAFAKTVDPRPEQIMPDYVDLGLGNASAPGTVASWWFGYDIDPKDMRRGDIIAICWNCKDGHAVFCWDVHVNDKDEVDAFQLVSSNFKVGVSVATNSHSTFFDIDSTHHKYTHKYKKPKMGADGKQERGADKKLVFTDESEEIDSIVYTIKKTKGKETLFVDHPDYIQYGNWYALPGVAKGSIDLKTFKTPRPTYITYAGTSKYSILQLRVARFFGFKPPTRLQATDKYSKNFALATQLGYETQPGSYATGTSPDPDPHIKGAPATVVSKPADGSPPKKADPKKVEQPTTSVATHQNDVEVQLKELFDGKVIDTDPGDATSVNDAQTQDAVKAFQQKFGLAVDGIAGPNTRAALTKQIALLRDQQRAQQVAQKPACDSKPVIDRLYWLKNQVDVGGLNVLTLTGTNLHVFESFDVYLKDSKSGTESKLTLPLVAAFGVGARPVQIPDSFGAGTVLTARVEVDTSDGKVSKSSDVPLYVGLLASPAGGTSSANWEPFIGKPSVPSDVCDKITAARAAMPVAKLIKTGVGHMYGPMGTPHTKWVASYLDGKASSASGVEKMRLLAFKAFQAREGSTSSINTYDNQYLTWGTGFSGLGDLGTVMTPLATNVGVAKLFRDCGFKYAGDPKKKETVNTYHTVDLNRKVVVSGSADPLKLFRQDIQLCHMLVRAAEGEATRQAVVDAQLAAFRLFKGADQVTDQSLFNFILHLNHWMPAWAYGIVAACVKSGATVMDTAHACSNYFFTVGSKTSTTRTRHEKYTTAMFNQHLKYYDHMKEDGLTETLVYPTEPPA